MTTNILAPINALTSIQRKNTPGSMFSGSILTRIT